MQTIVFLLCISVMIAIILYFVKKAKELDELIKYNFENDITCKDACEVMCPKEDKQ